jgi:hypothetical protein
MSPSVLANAGIGWARSDSLEGDLPDIASRLRP